MECRGRGFERPCPRGSHQGHELQLGTASMTDELEFIGDQKLRKTYCWDVHMVIDGNDEPRRYTTYTSRGDAGIHTLRRHHMDQHRGHPERPVQSGGHRR